MSARVRGFLFWCVCDSPAEAEKRIFSTIFSASAEKIVEKFAAGSGKNSSAAGKRIIFLIMNYFLNNNGGLVCARGAIRAEHLQPRHCSGRLGRLGRLYSTVLNDADDSDGSDDSDDSDDSDKTVKLKFWRTAR